MIHIQNNWVVFSYLPVECNEEAGDETQFHGQGDRLVNTTTI